MTLVPPFRGPRSRNVLPHPHPSRLRRATKRPPLSPVATFPPPGESLPGEGKNLASPVGKLSASRLTDGGCEAELHVDHKETRLIKQVGFRVYLLNQKEKRLAFASRFMLALPIFPARLQASIFGRSELNFRVRNGNGWTLAVRSTNCMVEIIGIEPMFAA